MTALHYSAFGLRIRSDVELPELFSAPRTRAPDVTIRRSPVALDPFPGPGVHALDGGVLLVIQDIASFWIVDGREVTVDAFANAPEANVRLYLLGSVMGVLLHQRAVLPLHANAIEIDGAAFAFMGASGAGKSTLAAWFHDRGFRIIADDISVVTMTSLRRPIVHPGIPRLRLWREALEASGRAAGDHPLTYEGDESYHKHDVRIMAEEAAREPRPLAAIYLLDGEEGSGIEPIHGVAATEAIFAHTYRGGYVPVASKARDHWATALQLVQSIPIFRLRRRWGLTLLDQECTQLLDHLRQVPLPRPAATRASA